MKIKSMITDPSARKTRIYALAVILILSGAILGIAATATADDKSSFYNFFVSGGLCFQNGGSTVYEVLKSNFLGILLLIAFLMLSGLFAFGQSVAVPVLFYRGFSFGSAVCIAMSEFGIRGIAISLVIIFPFGILTLAAVLFGVRETVRHSNMLFMYLFFGREKENTVKNTKLYFLRFFVLMLFSCICIIIQAMLLYVTVKFLL